MRKGKHKNEIFLRKIEKKENIDYLCSLKQQKAYDY